MRAGIAVAGALLLAAFVGCSSGNTTTGGRNLAQCEVCASDADCGVALVCRDYGMMGGSSLGHRCSTSGTGSSCTINDTPGQQPVDHR
jgi:hypothetical protein